MPVSGWQGIRAGDASGQYLITGTSDSNGLLYEGPISGVGGTSYSVNYPGADTTSVYGPDNLGNGELRLVGSYNDGTGQVRASSSRARPPISPTAAITRRSTIPMRDVHVLSQHDGRPGRRQRRRSEAGLPAIDRTTRSFTTSRQVRS